MAESLEITTVKNISFNAVGKIIAFIFQSLASVILSRELVAEDYGVAGFAMICVTFMRSFSGFGINRAAVHADTFDDIAVYTAFTLRQIFGFLAFSITIALSFFVDHFVQHPAITSVIRVLAFAILIDSFALVSTVFLERNLRFAVVSFAETILVIANSLLAIFLALNGYKYWSIVYGFLVANITFTLIVYLYVPYKIKFAINRKIAKQYLTYGSVVFFTGLLLFAILNMDNFLIGTIAGVEQLGYYSIAFNWGAMVSTIMGAVVFSVLFPTFSRMRDDAEQMKRVYLQVIRYTAIFSVLCNAGLFCVAENFLVYVLGKSTDKWLPSLMTLRILCAYGIIRALIEPVVSFMMAQGQTKIPFKANLLVVLLEFVMVYPAIKLGSIELVGVVVAVVYFCQVFIYLPALKRTNNVGVIDIIASIWPALLSGLTIVSLYFFLESYFKGGLAMLGGSIVFMTAVYFLSYGVLTRWKVYLQFKDLVVGRR